MKLNYISLFSCAGIGCYGFLENNYECLSTVEINNKRLEFQKFNKKCLKDKYYINQDILLDSTKQQLKNNLLNKNTDVLIATPPCQGMSMANHKKNNKDINKNSLIVESIKIINMLKPKIFIFENVRNFLKTNCYDDVIKPIKEAINFNLSSNYNIDFKILNFKEYGSNSSRNRTLVIGVRKDLNINPDKLFPDKKPIKNLKNSIGHLKPLKRNEIDKDDILHFSRKMNDRHYLWISNTPIGKSAFDNKNIKYIPHIIDNGKRRELKKIVKGKFTRLKWSDSMQCIHTRSDAPNSQYTIHPFDNRVYSIRELILLQGISENFKWSNKSLKELNNLSLNEKRKWLKNNERLIRTVIGESVPTVIFKQIALKIKQELNNL